jgi:hypothetical protein
MNSSRINKIIIKPMMLFNKIIIIIRMNPEKCLALQCRKVILNINRVRINQRMA